MEGLPKSMGFSDRLDGASIQDSQSDAMLQLEDSRLPAPTAAPPSPLHVQAIVNRAAMNIGIHVSF